MASMILEAVIIAFSASLDAFATGFAYGSKNIRIPMLPAQIINVISSALLGLAIFIGSIIRPYLPDWVTGVLCFGILFILGTVKLLDSITKRIIKRGNITPKEVRCTFLNFNFVMKISPSLPEKCGAETPISPVEAVALAIALSLDGLGVGVGIAMSDINAWLVIAASLIINWLSITAGNCMGRRVAKKLPVDLSWLSGIMLLGLAIVKL